MDLTQFRVCEEDLTPKALSDYQSAQAIAVDTETMGLNPLRDRLCLVQLCDEKGEVTVVRIAKGQTAAPRLKELMEAPDIVKIFHFARFDVTQLYHALGIQTNPVFCTKIASKLARTYSSSHGLKTLVQEIAQVELDKSAQSSDWGNAAHLSDEQLAYAANDVRFLHQIRDRLVDMLRREDRYFLAQECFSCIPVFVRLDLMQYKDVFEH